MDPSNTSSNPAGAKERDKVRVIVANFAGKGPMAWHIDPDSSRPNPTGLELLHCGQSRSLLRKSFGCSLTCSLRPASYSDSSSLQNAKRAMLAARCLSFSCWRGIKQGGKSGSSYSRMKARTGEAPRLGWSYETGELTNV